MHLLCRLSAVLLLCSFIACNGRFSSEADTKEAPVATQETLTSENVADTIAVPHTPAPDQQPAGTPPTPNFDWDKKIIKNANLAIEVKDFKLFTGQLYTAIKQAGGYVAQSEQTKSDYRIENVVTIKVPVDQFDNAVAALTAGKENVITQKITSQDVTGEVIDTKSRLEAKKQVRERYMDMLKQAKNMGEVLQVQKEINSLQVEMEAAAGRINYLSHSSAMSTIELTYYQVLQEQPNDNVKPSFGQRVFNALSGGLEWLGELLVLLLSLWPLWLLLGGVWWAYKKLKTSKTKTT